MTDYYTALWPKPALFKYGMESTSVPADRPDYVSAEVTPAMLAAALNYLGDCLFFGEGLTEDPASAAACYREVVEMRIPIPRGESLPQGMVWAQYSYGWCLLHGVGVPEDPRGHPHRGAGTSRSCTGPRPCPEAGFLLSVWESASPPPRGSRRRQRRDPRSDPPQRIGNHPDN